VVGETKDVFPGFHSVSFRVRARREGTAGVSGGAISRVTLDDGWALQVISGPYRAERTLRNTRLMFERAYVNAVLYHPDAAYFEY